LKKFFLDPNDWETIKPYFDELQTYHLTKENADEYLENWSDLITVLDDAFFDANRSVTENTSDKKAEELFLHLVNDVIPKVETAEQKLRQKFLELKDYKPSEENVELIRRWKTKVALFRDQNVPLFAELSVLANEYDKTIGSMNVTIDGREMTLDQANEFQFSPDRTLRKRSWIEVQKRWLEDRAKLNDLYIKMLSLRRQIARNADFQNFRDYIWNYLYRFSYNPDDCMRLHEAIATEIVPFLQKQMQDRCKKMKIDKVRPWDIDADPLGRPALKPFEKTSELEDGVQRIFTKIDPALGRYFSSMREDFLDLQSRPNKAPGAYCGGYNATGKPYIFANTVGINDDVNTLLHESGHAFHFIESSKQKLVWNKSSLEAVNYEFAEVASMSMELLGSTYLEKADGGFYDKDDANRARSEQLLGIMMFLPYMSVVDLFQHWVYTEAPQEISPADLDREWGALWARFMSWQDWSDFEDEKVTGWHRKGHIFSSPFYYIEYGLAQLGAIQMWRNFMHDKGKTVHDYRFALSLGNTKSLPQLFKSAGIEIIFDRSKLHELMEFVQNQFERFL